MSPEDPPSGQRAGAGRQTPDAVRTGKGPDRPPLAGGSWLPLTGSAALLALLLLIVVALGAPSDDDADVSGPEPSSVPSASATAGVDGG